MKEFRRIERTQFIAFYVSGEEKEAIVAAATENDMSISDYCRKTLLKRNEKNEEEKENV